MLSKHLMWEAVEALRSRPQGCEPSDRKGRSVQELTWDTQQGGEGRTKPPCCACLASCYHGLGASKPLEAQTGRGTATYLVPQPSTTHLMALVCSAERQLPTPSSSPSRSIRMILTRHVPSSSPPSPLGSIMLGGQGLSSSLPSPSGSSMLRGQGLSQRFRPPARWPHPGRPG